MPLLREIGIGSDIGNDRDAAFRLQTRYILALIQRLLVPSRHSTARKILIKCRSHGLCQPHKVIGGVLDIDVVADARLFFDLSPDKKNEFVVDILCRGLEFARAIHNIDVSPFIDAIKKAGALGYVNKFISPKHAKLSPNRRLQAELQCMHDSYKFSATLVVSDRKKTELSRITAFETRPSEWSFVPKLETLKWLDNDRLIVDGKVFLLHNKSVEQIQP